MLSGWNCKCYVSLLLLEKGGYIKKIIMELMILCGSTSDPLRQLQNFRETPCFKGNLEVIISFLAPFMEKLSEMVIRNIKGEMKCILTLDVTIAFYIYRTPFLIFPALI